MSFAEEDKRVADQVQQMLDTLKANYLGFSSQSRFVDTSDADRQFADEDRAIAESAGVIIIYGRAAREWLTTKIMRANQLRGRASLRWGALIDAPAPNKPLPPVASSIERHDWRAGPRFDLLKQFIESLTAPAHV